MHSQDNLHFPNYMTRQRFCRISYCFTDRCGPMAKMSPANKVSPNRCCIPSPKFRVMVSVMLELLYCTSIYGMHDNLHLFFFFAFSLSKHRRRRGAANKFFFFLLSTRLRTEVRGYLVRRAPIKFLPVIFETISCMNGYYCIMSEKIFSLKGHRLRGERGSTKDKDTCTGQH